MVEGFLSGLHRSPYFGQSVEFVQHREYAPGDDYRRIDWKVWSKTDKYYIKQYEEDTNLRTTLVVDLSESMKFGSGAMTKYEYTCTVAAALSYLLLKQQDAVGLTTEEMGVLPRILKMTGISSTCFRGVAVGRITGIESDAAEVAFVFDSTLKKLRYWRE